MLLVSEAGYVVIWLRLKVDAVDAALGEGGEQRQLAAVQQGVHQRGDENGLAGPGQAGDANAQGGRNDAGGKVLHPARRIARFVVEA
jgi:hypothetical protein